MGSSTYRRLKKVLDTSRRRLYRTLKQMSKPILTPTPLRAMRLARGFTIRRMEELTGINRGRLSVLERGVQPSPEELTAIMAVLLEERS